MLDVALLHQRALRLLRDKGKEQWDRTYMLCAGNVLISGSKNRLTIQIGEGRVRAYQCTFYRSDVEVKFDSQLIPKVIEALNRTYVLDSLADV